MKSLILLTNTIVILDKFLKSIVNYFSKSIILYCIAIFKTFQEISSDSVCSNLASRTV